MDREQIHEAALHLQVTPQALDAVIAKVLAHFGEGKPRPVEAAQYIAALPVWDKLGMSQEQFAAMPPTWRLQQGLAYQPPPAQRRPTMRELTAEELAAIEGLPRHERHERARVLQQTPLPPEQP